jgi:hypothetical protein
MIKNIVFRAGVVILIFALFVGSGAVPKSVGALQNIRMQSDDSGIPPNRQWDDHFIFAPSCEGNWVEQTSDGGFIITGGKPDGVLLIKTDRSGSVDWNMTYHGPEPWVGFTVHQTSDGGYIIIGSTITVHGTWNNSLLIKTDERGNELWHQILGGVYPDRTLSGQQTNDSGYIMTGLTTLNGTTDSLWLIKTDSNGIEQWNRTYGQGLGNSVQQTTDNGYIITGETWGVMTPTHITAVKTDFYGNLEWNKTYETPFDDYGSAVQQTADDGYVIFGDSYRGEMPHGRSVAFLIKTDTQGNEQWNMSYGNDTGEDTHGASIRQTSDHGFIMTGMQVSNSTPGWYNIWLVRTDREGRIQWERTFNSEGFSDNFDQGTSVQQTTDGGYIVIGTSSDYVIWLIKLAPESPLRLTFIIGKISWLTVLEKYSIMNAYRTFVFPLFPLKFDYLPSGAEIIVTHNHIGILTNTTIAGLFKAHI